MAERTGIQWTDATWNPWYGCTKVSPGCTRCYMFTEQRLYGRDPAVVVRSKTTFNAPLKWSMPRRVFTCSWSDFFHEAADPWRAEAWDIIRRTPHLTYQILTKRPERIAPLLPVDWGRGWPHVWLGVSAESQIHADRRIPLLLMTPAAVRFVSAEPLLGPLEFRLFPPFIAHLGAAPVECPHGHDACPTCDRGVDWVVVGGESGPGARACEIGWLRGVVAQCQHAYTPVFVKQLGSNVRHEGKPLAIRLRDRKGGDITEWPEDLRVREFPADVHTSASEAQ